MKNLQNQGNDTLQQYKNYLEDNNLADNTGMKSKQFNTIQATAQSHLGINSSSADAEKLKINAKNAKKTHMRSITSQKGESDNVSHGRNGGRRQPSASGQSGKHRGESNDVNNTNKDFGKEQYTYGQTIQNQQNGPDDSIEGKFQPNHPSSSGQTKKSRGQSEDRTDKTSALAKGMGHNVRASISKEVTTATAQQSVQPRQASKKFDNCVTKFAFATKTGYSPKNPNKTNQDSFLVLPHLGEYRRTHFFAVADGHGVNGKLVSEYVKTVLAKEVEQSIKYTFD
jgi:hypothetical protein